MDAVLEKQVRRTTELMLDVIRMTLIEYRVSQMKQGGEITQERYDVFRKVADKHLDENERQLQIHGSKLRKWKARRYT